MRIIAIFIRYFVIYRDLCLKDKQEFLMKIEGLLTDEAILAELGGRLARRRLELSHLQLSSRRQWINEQA